MFHWPRGIPKPCPVCQGPGLRSKREQKILEFEKRKKEEARKREIAHQEEEERTRREEERRLEEERRQQQQAEEDARQEALLLEEEKHRQELESAAERESLREKNQHLHTAVHKPFLAIESSHKQLQEVQSGYDANIPDNATFLKTEVSNEIDTVSAGLVQTVQFSISRIDENEELSGWWLKAAQTLLLTYYLQCSGFSAEEKDLLLDFLAFLQTNLSDWDCYTLADSFSYLVAIPPEDLSSTFTIKDNISLPAKVSSLLIQSAKHLEETSLWMQRCIYTYVMATTADEQIHNMYSEVYCNNWSGYNWLRFFDVSKEHLSADHHKQALHLIQTYCVKPSIIMNGLEDNPQNTVATVNAAVESDKNKLLVDIFDEIRGRDLVEEDLLSQVESIAIKAFDSLQTFDIREDHNQQLELEMSKTVSTIRRLADPNTTVSDEDIAEAMVNFMCACQKVKHWYHRRTQMVSLLLLLLSSRQQSNLLLEMMTGEGKSLVVTFFAIVLALQGKHVDIVTSSPILAVRDVEDYGAIFDIYNVSVTHNTDFNTENSNLSDEKRKCYAQNVVYGTVSSFAGDILRQEFEQERTRESRRFDAIVVDEVDMLMLDEGVQFTYLSHKAAILQHIEPVIAAVWGVIGPLKLITTINGQILYAGSTKLFTQTIYECLDPELSGIQSHSQILTAALQQGSISLDQFENLLIDDQEVKKLTIAQLTAENALTLINGLESYENMPEFKAYTVNSLGLLEPVTSVTDEQSAEKLLLLENGLACILNTQEEIVERGSAIVKSRLNFSDTKSDTEINLPNRMENFTLNQLPVYVENALRALHMEEDREYAITHGRIIPVDFQNSGVMELNKKWGGGLQQMLELKHSLTLTPMSLVTNFMSNVEFFSRYKRDGGIYGMSGTLGLDKHSNTASLLNELYNTKVCGIPTFKFRKLFEKPAIIVDNDEQWFKQIVRTVEEEGKEEFSWKKGRAALILCEDIKMAEDLRKYVIETEKWEEDRVYLYAHSNSKQLNYIKRKLGPGEVIIATNLAGRGTNIKVNDDVNLSGGLLCLVTFLARNRRVELQAFGRTARGGKPGNVRCILNYSAMPSQYNGMSIEQIRELRAEEEAIRLRQLMDFDVKEVQLKELLFSVYCRSLQKVYERARGRDDKTVIVNSLNEKWGEWLQMKSGELEGERAEQHLAGLFQIMQQWNPTIPDSDSEPVHLSVANFYHFVQFGNQLLTSESVDDAKRAHAYFTESIQYESRFAAIAHYNRAYAAIIAQISNYKQKAKEDIQAALAGLDMYTAEVSTISLCAAVVRQVRDFEQREVQDYGAEGEKAEDLNTQIQVRFEIIRFLKEKMGEAIQKIDEISGDVIVKSKEIFSLIPGADYTTNVELARFWSLGLEIVYTIEEKPRFCWDGLIVFLLGVVQIVGGVLLTVFTAGAAAQFGLALIGEGVSDCIDGIIGMITGEFSWTEWAITKATGIALSLVSGGVSRLATTGLKAIKIGYKIAKTGRQLKAIPNIVRTTTKAAAKSNLKTAAKYVAQEAVLQGLSFTQAKFMNMALDKVAELIGAKLKEKFMDVIREAFSSGYLGTIVNKRFAAELNRSYKNKFSVPATMKTRGKKIFSNVGDYVASEFNTNSELKERLATSSLALFSQISQRSQELRGVANLAEAAITVTIVADAATSLDFLVDEFPTKMEEVCKQFVVDGKIVLSSRAVFPFKNYDCMTRFRKNLANHVGEIFANTVAILLQGKLRPLVNQYQMTNKMGRLTSNVIGRYVLKRDQTIEEIRSMQHANYIRSVGFDPTGNGPVSNITIAKLYAEEIASSDTPGSLMELRVAAEHFGQKVTVYTEVNGKLLKDTSINPTTKKTQDEVKLVYIPPPDPTSVGHYDVMIGKSRKRVQADQSNCLFHAYAFSRNPKLSRTELQEEAALLRDTVSTKIKNEPGKFAEHIKLRVQMENLQRGNRFAIIGAGSPNSATKVLDGFYKQAVLDNKIYTMYEQDNGVKCKAVRRYNKNLTVVNKRVQEADARLESFEVTMTGLNLYDAAGKRCWDTKPVVGMIKRPTRDPNFDVKDTEVSYHLCPSRGGANSGDPYANGIPASYHYNDLEKYIWSQALQNAIGNHDFSMTVRGFCGPLDQEYKGTRDIDDATKQLLKKRYALIQALEPRAYRLQDPTTFTVFLPAAAAITQKDLDDIATATNSKKSMIGVDTDLASKTVTFYMPQDYELFTPFNHTKLQSNGELYPGELTNAKRKKEYLTVDEPPYYRGGRPKGGKTAQDKMDFDDEADKFMV